MPMHPDRKAETRHKILVAAAAEIRASGPQNVSVVGVMAKAGLTQGGFYAHFESKDDLICHAIPAMFDQAYGYFLEETEGAASAHLGMSLFVHRYLSMYHRDHPEIGCPICALSSELARLPATRGAFAAGAERFRLALTRLVSTITPEHPEETATSTMAELVGALSVARALENPKESQAVLDACCSSLRRRLNLPLPP